MDVRVGPSGEPVLDEPDDFRSLRLTGTRPSSDAARAALSSAGIELDEDGGHGHIEPTAFTRLAGSAGERPDWQDGLAAMLAYAVDHGWTDDAGRVRAHAEWQP